MNKRKCIKCNSLNITKKGYQNNTQRYYCKDCKTKFQIKTNRKALPKTEELFYSFSFHKQTLKELSRLYHIRTSIVQKLFDEYVLPKVIHTPREVYLQVDATYFGSKESKFCLILFRDHVNKENLWWTFCDVERDKYYWQGRLELERLGYVIKGVTTDGLPLFRRVFKDIPHQMCLVHMERIIIRGTTRKPKLEASIALYALGRSIYTIDEKEFNMYMNKYTLKYFHFLNEKTISEVTGESWYTHERLREAFISLQHLQDYLFTYMKGKNISRNTNSIEGTFAHLKIKVKAHHGLSLERKKKVIEILLHYGSGVFDYEK
jgi:hypothetical protein